MRKVFPTIQLLILIPVAVSGQEAGYTMRSIDDYLMEESYEIALATSAAPENVSSRAAVLVLRRDGYHGVRHGSNGFTCLVERSWASPIGLHRDFFNPSLRAPICYNEEATRTVLGDYLRRTELAMAGASIAEIKAAIQTDIAEGKLAPPRRVAMSYMMSAGQLLGTNVGRFKPHVMFYIPYTRNEDLGGHAPNSEHPTVFEHEGGPYSSIIVPVSEFIEVTEPEPSD